MKFKQIRYSFHFAYSTNKSSHENFKKQNLNIMVQKNLVKYFKKPPKWFFITSHVYPSSF